jgi:2-polyprenyl-3-methyl-5-hydroxy-6-metoxy-1,4-benzoquinol methylase
MKIDLSRHEPPRKSWRVKMLKQCNDLLLGKGLETPHYATNGTVDDTPKIQYEYNNAPAFLEILGRYLDIPTAFDQKEILDVGCGWGGKTVYFAEHLSIKHITGFDLPGYRPESSMRFAEARGVQNCTFGVGFAENPFDGFFLSITFCLKSPL